MPYDHEDPETLFGEDDSLLPGDEEIEQSDLTCPCFACMFELEQPGDDPRGYDESNVYDTGFDGYHSD